jgi:diadenosine tetraphosphate (Ap4A) HIT family hydrolase
MAIIPDIIQFRKNKVPVSLRTYRDELRYTKSKKSRNNNDTKHLANEDALKEWSYWRLIHNAYPYSSAFKVHHLLVPKRVVAKTDLNQEELAELDSLTDELSDVYDCLLINFPKKQSIRNHFHVHLLTYKDKRSELGRLN